MHFAASVALLNPNFISYLSDELKIVVFADVSLGFLVALLRGVP